jgi:hypothetical protein
MTDEKNDMIPPDPEKRISASLESHLRPLMYGKDLDKFRDQLPKDFVIDATEGLDLLKNKEQLESVLQQLNRQMHQQVKQKSARKRKSAIGNLSPAYWAIIIILLLVFIGFIVIRMLLRS